MNIHPHTPLPTKPRILVVLHQEASTPGRVGLKLRQMGFDIVACRPVLGEKLPTSLEEYSGAIVFGGPMSANDKDDFIKDEINWMEVPLQENKPFLGICLGAQMLTKYLGGEVCAHPDNQVEIGYYPIEPTKEGSDFIQWPSHVYHWHREGFSLPKDATLLASGEAFENQAFQYGENAFAVQFHSEVTHLMMNRWTTLAWERLELPGAQTRQEHFSNRLIYDKAVDQWLEGFLKKWIIKTKVKT